MPGQIVRVLTSGLVFVLGCLLYLGVFVTCDHAVSRVQSMHADEWVPCACAGLIAWMFIRIAWHILWKPYVVSTSFRRALDDASAIGMIVAGTLIGLSVSRVDQSMLPWFLGSTIAPVLQLIVTPWIYRETPAQRAARAVEKSTDRVVCPACGYNMTGLTAARCPECGAQYTLNALLAAQRSETSGGLAAP